MVGAAVDLVTQGRARGGGSPLAQRAGGQIHAGGQLPVGVAGEPGMGLVQGIGVLHGIEAHQAEGGVGHRARVTLAEHQPVAVGIPGVLGVKMHDLAVQYGHQVRQVHGAAHVAEAAGMDDLQRLQPDLGRQGLDFLLVHCVSFLIQNRFEFLQSHQGVDPTAQTLRKPYPVDIQQRQGDENPIYLWRDFLLRR